MRSRLLTLLLLAGLGVAANPRAVAGAELLDSFALPSTPDGTTPLSVGGGAKKWVYPSFCSTGSFVQTFPLNLQFSGGTGAQTTVHFSAKGNLKSFATVPADVLLTDDGSVQGPFNISVNASGLAPGNYGLNVRLSGSDGFTPKHKMIQVNLVVGATCAGVGSVIAFFSDDQLSDLVDCSGTDVGVVPNGGTFQINPAPPMDSIVGSTTPASLYYSFIWSNTGPNAVPELDLAATGLTPSGLDAVHVMAFDTATFSADLATFQSVNSGGTSCGASGPCILAVNGGQTLWATWSVGWSGVGGPTAGLSLSCPGNADVTETSTLVNGTSTLALSQGGATGYLVCMKGDVNGDGAVNVGDVFYMINYLFASGPAPFCATSGNVNADANSDVADVFFLINYLFAGGPAPM